MAVWLALVAGFTLDMIRKDLAHKLNFPLIIHAHAAVYTGWLVLLAAQVWLIRTGKLSLHMRLGQIAVPMIGLMIVLGPAAALQKTLLPQATDHTLAFLSTQFTNVLGMAVLLICGVLARHNPAAHKRLMLMGAIAITEPGFAKLYGAPLHAILGDGFWPYMAFHYSGTIALMLAVGAYDLYTRHRLHPAYIGAFVWVLMNELVAAWLYYQPFWLEWMKRLTGH